MHCLFACLRCPNNRPRSRINQYAAEWHFQKLITDSINPCKLARHIHRFCTSVSSSSSSSFSCSPIWLYWIAISRPIRIQTAQFSGRQSIYCYQRPWRGYLLVFRQRSAASGIGINLTHTEMAIKYSISIAFALGSSQPRMTRIWDGGKTLQISGDSSILVVKESPQYRH